MIRLVKVLNGYSLGLICLALEMGSLNPVQGASFVTNNPLNTARQFQSATLLSNGKLLVVGGCDINLNAFSSAELYDALSGKWAATSNLVDARCQHTATLLPNGKVLVAGGLGSNGCLASSEIYDPVTGTWSKTHDMNTARYNHAATLLPSGKVLVAGGYNGGLPLASWLASAEIYDPDTGLWTLTGALNVGRQYHTATLLTNGLVLVAGGEAYEDDEGMIDLGYNDAPFPSAELYDPGSGIWTPTGELNHGRKSHTATLLPNGKVLVAGGEDTDADDDSAVNTAELYNPVTGTWAATGVLSDARQSHTATLQPNGRVLVIGGYGGEGYPSLSSAELFNPATGKWTVTNALNTARAYHTATLQPNGRLLVIGGLDDNSNVLASVESYDPAVATSKATPALANAREYHTATLLLNGKVLIAGGLANTAGTLSSAVIYDPIAGTAPKPTTNTMAYKRRSHTATLLASGDVLVAGGFDGTSYLNSAELYKPATSTWTNTGAMTIARENHTATLLSNGKVLIVGGFDGTKRLAGAVLYNPDTGYWTNTGSLNFARENQTTTTLPDGRILVAGGFDGTNYLAGTELFDPATGVWTVNQPMNAARANHTTTLLPNGKVLVAGGYNGTNYLSGAEMYDPVTRIWSAASPLSHGRANHTATLLLNGTILVSGGLGTGGVTNSMELYNTVDGSWSDTIPLKPTARYLHTATLLLDGRVLLAGGNKGPVASPILTTMELYDIGLGYTSTWQPQMASATSPLIPGGNLVITGSQFRGVSEGSAGNTQDSPGDCPVVQLRNLESGETLTLRTTNWTASTFTSMPVRGLPTGWTLATMFVNGIPSTSALITVGTNYGTATVNLENLIQAYDGTARNVTATTTPPGLPVNLTYDGSPNAPTNVGSYTVVGTISDPNYQGSATDTLVINPADVSIILSNLLQTYDGLAKPVVATADPPGVPIALTYNGQVNPPTNVGSYTIIATVSNPNYAGAATNTLTIAKATATFTLTNLWQIYDGTARAVTAITMPPGLSVSLTYDGLFAPPTNVGNYTVIGMVNDSNYGGGTTNTLAIGKATALVALTNLSQTYDGTNKTVTATTVPTNLSVVITYNGVTNPPINPGSYTVIGTITNLNYLGSATNTLVIVHIPKFIPTGALSTGRYYHTANLLPDGRVLVAGGDGISGALVSCEIYDPATGYWSPAGSLTDARFQHTATRLSNGKVLVAGGIGVSGYLTSAEIYDPATGKWGNTGNLNTARSGHTAVLLLSGKVLIAGGSGAGGYLASAELYDPATETWTSTGSLIGVIYSHPETLLPDGIALIAGGYNGTNNLATTEQFDPLFGTWTSTGSLASARRDHVAILLNSGKVLVAGGWVTMAT